MRPIYKASFSIGTAEQKPKLESIIETAKFWAGEKMPENPLEGFEKGVSIDTPKGNLKTVSVDEGAVKYFGMCFDHPDAENPDFKWEAKFAIKEEENKPHTVGITLSNGWTGNIIRPNWTEVTRPSLVWRLVDKFPAYEGYKLGIKSVLVRSKDVKSLVSGIFDKKRNLPIVCISSKNVIDKPIANDGKVASLLAGIAHTCTINKFGTFELAEQIGKSLSCYNGAVRIYWPIGNSDPASVHHKIWFPQDVFEVGDRFPQEVLKEIARFSVGRTLPITFEDVKMREALSKIRAAGKDSAELEAVVRLYEDEKAALQLTCEEKDEQIRGLTIKLSALEYALANKKGPANVEEAAFVEPKTVEEAVARFKELYSDSQAVMITSKAEDMAKSCPYENPTQLYRALEWLATRYHAARTNNARIQDLDENCMNEIGMHYKGKQSSVTMGQFREDYFTKIDGRNIPLEEHIRKGTSKDPRQTVSIAFYYDEDTKKVIIGFIGQHQETRST
jgi:hypothetical protein